MTAMMIATTALIIAASSSHNSGNVSGPDVPLTEFGSACLFVSFACMALALLFGTFGISTNNHERSNKLMIAFIWAICIGLVAAIVGVAHDCAVA